MRNIALTIIALMLVTFGWSYAGIGQSKIYPDTTPVVDSSTITPESTTWAVLNAAAAGGTLTPGKWYTISDFRTYHKIPGTLAYNTGPIEPLTVQTITTTEIGPYAYSSTYPNDVILYELNDSTTYTFADRGRITYRRDPALNISAYVDWRAVKFRRWESSPGENDWNQFADPGEGDMADLYMIQNTPTPTRAQAYNITLGANMGTMDNVTIGQITGQGQNYNITTGDNVHTVAIGMNANTISIAHSNATLRFGYSTHHISVGCCCDGLNVGYDSYNVTIGDSTANILVDVGSYDIVVGAYTANWNIQGSMIEIGPRMVDTFDVADTISAPGYYGMGRSTMRATITPPLNDLQVFPWVGIINAAYDGTGIINTIGNLQANHPVRLVSDVLWSITNTSMVMPQALHNAGGFIINGANGDWVEFENKGGTVYYKAHQNYRAP